MAESCLIPRRAAVEKRRFNPRAGVEGLAYMHARTREDPFYALASGLLHAGQTSYITQQPIVERLMRDPGREDKLASVEGAYAAIRGSGFVNLKARAWPAAIDCWRKWCKTEDDPRGGACVSKNGKLSARAIHLMRCMHKRLPAGVMGRKSYNLMAEYLGCDYAVAADRHVANWLTNSAGTLVWAQKVFYNRAPTQTCEAPFQAQERGPYKKPICAYEGRVFFTREESEAKKMQRLGIPAVSGSTVAEDAKFAMLKREIGSLAKGCGIKPAEMQVAAWTQGACDSLPAGASKKLDFGRGHVIDCDAVPRVDIGAPTRGYKLTMREKVPGRGFRCRPDHLGSFGQSPQAVDLVTRPVRVPFGAKLQFDTDIYPVVPEERLAAWTSWRPRRAPAAEAQIPALLGRLLTRKKSRRRMGA